VATTPEQPALEMQAMRTARLSGSLPLLITDTVLLWHPLAAVCCVLVV
jgi:hypothetical protein